MHKRAWSWMWTTHGVMDKSSRREQSVDMNSIRSRIVYHDTKFQVFWWQRGLSVDNLGLDTHQHEN